MHEHFRGKLRALTVDRWRRACSQWIETLHCAVEVGIFGRLNDSNHLNRISQVIRSYQSFRSFRSSIKYRFYH
jgi:hypothetical protein